MQTEHFGLGFWVHSDVDSLGHYDHIMTVHLIDTPVEHPINKLSPVDALGQDRHSKVIISITDVWAKPGRAVLMRLWSPRPLVSLKTDSPGFFIYSFTPTTIWINNRSVGQVGPQHRLRGPDLSMAFQPWRSGSTFLESEMSRAPNAIRNKFLPYGTSFNCYIAIGIGLI